MSVGGSVSVGGSLALQCVLVGSVQSVVVAGFELVLLLVVLQTVSSVGWGCSLQHSDIPTLEEGTG